MFRVSRVLQGQKFKGLPRSMRLPSKFWGARLRESSKIKSLKPTFGVPLLAILEGPRTQIIGF